MSRAMISPTLEQIQEFLIQFKTELSSDPDLAAAYKMFPKQVLANRGINIDLQAELIAETGVINAATCYATCACTGCCNTSSQ